MKIDNILSYLESVLYDEESVYVLKTRVIYSVDKNIEKYTNHILDLPYLWTIEDLDLYFCNMQVSNIIIFGSGGIGKYSAKLIMKSIYRDVELIFIDNNQELWGSNIGIHKVFSPNIIHIISKGVVIIASSYDVDGIRQQILEMGIPHERVLAPVWSNMRMKGTRKINFFEFVKPNEHEVLLDIGYDDGYIARIFAEQSMTSECYLVRKTRILPIKNLIERNDNDCRIVITTEGLEFIINTISPTYIYVGDYVNCTSLVNEILCYSEGKKIKMVIDTRGNPYNYVEVTQMIVEANLGYNIAYREFYIPSEGPVLFVW